MGPKLIKYYMGKKSMGPKLIGSKINWVQNWMPPKLEMAPNKRGPKLKGVRYIGAHGLQISHC